MPTELPTFLRGNSWSFPGHLYIHVTINRILLSVHLLVLCWYINGILLYTLWCIFLCPTQQLILASSPCLFYLHLFFKHFIYWRMLHWVFTAVCGLSLGAASGDASPVAVRGFLPVVVPPLQITGSRPAGFRRRGSGTQQLCRLCLVAPQRTGSSQIRGRTRVLCVGTQSLKHWTTREVL